jgi:prepilin-type N-terminal cleavage/methylation domain-containing protein
LAPRLSIVCVFYVHGEKTIEITVWVLRMWYLDSAFLNYFRRDYMIIASAHKRTASAKKKSGFTLIELSIVLVIIGLIIGGVLVGQDLIKAAEIRATIGQYEKYNASINTFRTKYNSIPGDMPVADSTAFGLNATAGAMTDGTIGRGDGNGLIEKSGGNPTDTTFNLGEPLQFWGHLSRSNLIDGSLGAAMTTAGAVPSDLTAATATTYFPAAKSGRGGVWYVGSASGLNHYVLTGAGAVTTAGATTQASAVTPIEAFNIDSKIDDGLPNAGIVQARGTSGNPFLDLSHANAVPSASAATENASTLCQFGNAVSSTTSNTYARGSTAGSGVNCSLRFRFN